MSTNPQFATYPSLRERVVIVTGGASGIGEALVENFVQQGARTCFLDVQDDAAASLAHRFQDTERAPEYHRCDLTDIAALRSVLAKIASTHGTVDVLVNNAGNDERHEVDEVTPEFWDRIIAVNLKHQFFAAQAVAPVMRAAGRGSIINMSSIGWVIPSVRQSVYVTAKAAVIGMTRTLSHELGGDNIRVNAIMPGAVLTDRQKRLWLTEAYTAQVLGNQALKRMILPDEVARLALFLAAVDSAAITNQSYVIDAGWV